MSADEQPQRAQPDGDPFTMMAAAAVQLHEMFVSFLDAGFTEPQAIQLTAAIIRGGNT